MNKRKGSRWWMTRQSCWELIQLAGMLIGVAIVVTLLVLFIFWYYNDAPCTLFTVGNMPYRCLSNLRR